MHNPDVPLQKDLIPHLPLLLLFTLSAQTHIFPEIRIDAVRFLNLLLDTVPESVVCGWNETGFAHGKRALEGYLGILNVGTKFNGAEGLLSRLDYILVCPMMSHPYSGTAQATCTTSVVLSPQVDVLSTLFTLLTLSVKTSSFTVPFFFFESCNRLTVSGIRRRGWSSGCTNVVLTTLFREHSVIRRTRTSISTLAPRDKWQASGLECGSQVRVFRRRLCLRSATPLWRTRSHVGSQQSARSFPQSRRCIMSVGRHPLDRGRQSSYG